MCLAAWRNIGGAISEVMIATGDDLTDREVGVFPSVEVSLEHGLELPGSLLGVGPFCRAEFVQSGPATCANSVSR